MKLSQKELIKSFLRSVWAENPEQWTEGFRLDKREYAGQWLSHKASTRARELAVAREIERSYINGFACYRYLPSAIEIQIQEEKSESLKNRQLRLV